MGSCDLANELLFVYESKFCLASNKKYGDKSDITLLVVDKSYQLVLTHSLYDLSTSSRVISLT